MSNLKKPGIINSSGIDELTSPTENCEFLKSDITFICDHYMKSQRSLPAGVYCLLFILPIVLVEVYSYLVRL